MSVPFRLRTRLGLIVLALLTTVLAACGGDDGTAPDPTTTTAESTESVETAETEPVDPSADDPGSDDDLPNPDWTISDPESEGFDAVALEAVRAEAFADEHHTQGVVIVRHGRIVDEWYADGADADSWAASWSMAKSFASTLVGIAIDEGLIPGVDEPLTTWYPEWEERGLDDITLEHVLQMADGLDWDENYDPAAGVSDIIRMVLTEDPPLDYVLALDTVAEPGTRFNYSSGTTQLLSGILQQATGVPADEYAREKLFEPLGFSKVDWWRGTDGRTLTYCCVDTTSRDFARLGLLYLRDGRWGDEQIVSEDWVRDSLTPSSSSDGIYGYQWWLSRWEGLPDDLFSANGHDGQFVYVVPSLDLVVVRNGTYVKDPGDPVADPNLFSVYPPDDLVPGKGTIPPEDWDHAAFLGGIIDAITDP